MAKVEKFDVRGKSLTAKEKAVYDAVQKVGKAKAADLVDNADVAKYCANIASVRSTMARLEKTQCLFKANSVLVGDKVVKEYSVAEAE